MSSAYWPPQGESGTITGSWTSTGNIVTTDGPGVAQDSGTTLASLLPVAEYSNGSLGASPAINFANGPAQSGTLSANATATLSGGTSGQAYLLRIIQAASGGPYTLALTGVKWPGGTAITISTGASAIDIINLYYDGTHWYGTFAQAFA